MNAMQGRFRNADTYMGSDNMYGSSVWLKSERPQAFHHNHYVTALESGLFMKREPQYGCSCLFLVKFEISSFLPIA